MTREGSMCVHGVPLAVRSCGQCEVVMVGHRHRVYGFDPQKWRNAFLTASNPVGLPTRQLDGGAASHGGIADIRFARSNPSLPIAWHCWRCGGHHPQEWVTLDGKEVSARTKQRIKDHMIEFHGWWPGCEPTFSHDPGTFADLSTTFDLHSQRAKDAQALRFTELAAKEISDLLATQTVAKVQIPERREHQYLPPAFERRQQPWTQLRGGPAKDPYDKTNPLHREYAEAMGLDPDRVKCIPRSEWLAQQSATVSGTWAGVERSTVPEFSSRVPTGPGQALDWRRVGSVGESGRLPGQLVKPFGGIVISDGYVEDLAAQPWDRGNALWSQARGSVHRQWDDTIKAEPGQVRRWFRAMRAEDFMQDYMGVLTNPLRLQPPWTLHDTRNVVAQVTAKHYEAQPWRFYPPPLPAFLTAPPKGPLLADVHRRVAGDPPNWAETAIARARREIAERSCPACSTRHASVSHGSGTCPGRAPNALMPHELAQLKGEPSEDPGPAETLAHPNPRYANDPPTRHPRVRGQCPSCGSSSLFLGSGGYVTCSVIGCKSPGAPSDALKLAVTTREVEDLANELAALPERDYDATLMRAWKLRYDKVAR